jgi:hypothetical protein
MPFRYNGYLKGEFFMFFGTMTAAPKPGPSPVELASKAAADALGALLMLSDAYNIDLKELLDPTTLTWLEEYQKEQRAKWAKEQNDKREQAQYERIISGLSDEEIQILKRKMR